MSTSRSSRKSRALHLTKPYKGPLWRRGEWLPPVRFYDEREWRWVYGGETATVLEKHEWTDPAVFLSLQEELWERAVLSFEASDIRYLIVASEREANELLDALGIWWPRESELLQLVSNCVGV